jgi:hypothetical protein
MVAADLIAFSLFYRSNHHPKRVPMQKRRGKAMPVLGAAGLLALASGASAEAPVNTSTPNTGVTHPVLLGEEEISDVSLATFYVFDKENAGSLKPGLRLQRWLRRRLWRLWPQPWWRWWFQRLRWLRRWLLSWLWRRLQNRLRLWRLRRLWMRRMRRGLVGNLRRRVCRRWLLHFLGRLPLLLKRGGQSRTFNLSNDRQCGCRVALRSGFIRHRSGLVPTDSSFVDSGDVICSTVSWLVS